MAVAVIASNTIGLVFTIVFARVLGASDYGSLAVLVSAWIILMVPGSALQVAVAREVSRVAASDTGDAGAAAWSAGLSGLRSRRSWWRSRRSRCEALIAAIVNVDEDWAAAAVPLSGMLWALVSVERGALQGFGDYRTVALSVIGEAASRLLFALALVGIGLDVTGAFLGTPISLVAVGLAARGAAAAAPPRHARPGAEVSRLRDLLARRAVPVIGLTLLFALQELHVIVVKHEASSDAAGSYAVAAVAAKAIIWVAVGLGLYLLPEAAQANARPARTRARSCCGRSA